MSTTTKIKGLSLLAFLIGMGSVDVAYAGPECTDGVRSHASPWTGNLKGDAYTWKTSAQSLIDAAAKAKNTPPYIINNSFVGCSTGVPCVVVWAANKCGAGAHGHVALVYGTTPSAQMSDQGNPIGMCDYNKGTWSSSYGTASTMCSFQRAMQNKADKSCQSILSSQNFTVIHKNPSSK
jgi:hypothetical protein